MKLGVHRGGAEIAERAAESKLALRPSPRSLRLRGALLQKGNLSVLLLLSGTTVTDLKKEVIKEAAAGLVVLVVTAAVYGSLFNRETTLSYSIGYNLYGAERVLAGETPYLDFHTLYPPGTVYLNAALFKLSGVSLYSALFGVLIFKLAASLITYAGARIAMPRIWAVAAGLSSIVWLRPNGPFKAVPMHYGALFLAIALFCVLRSHRRKNVFLVFAAGLSIGLLALFKHNIGAYTLFGVLALELIPNGVARLRGDHYERYLKRPGLLIAGFLAPVVPVIVYLWVKGALPAMIKSLLFGPGEFLVARLAAAPSPAAPLLFLVALLSAAWGATRLEALRGSRSRYEQVFDESMYGRPSVAAPPEESPSLAKNATVKKSSLALALASGAKSKVIGSTLITAAPAIYWAAFMVLAITFALFAGQSSIDQLIFYGPVLVIISAVAACAIAGRISPDQRRTLGIFSIIALASFLEAFPRFAREQAIASMPFAVPALFYLLFVGKPVFERRFGRVWPAKLAVAILPLAFFAIGSRVFFASFLNRGLTFKSDTRLTSARGGGVYFPEKTAKEIDDVVAFIQERVPPGGFFFAESYAGSSFLFLSARNNPSGAQFWGGVGVTQAERERTLTALRNKAISLIVTSDRERASERYDPMREYIENNFKETRRFDEVVVLERTSENSH